MRSTGQCSNPPRAGWAHRSRRTSAIPIAVLRQQGVHQLLANVKIGRSEFCQCGWKLHQTTPRGAIENAQGTRDLDPLCAGHGNPGAIVLQQKVGLDRGGERDGCPFALVEGCERGVRSWGGA
jgi:hypothetical protein